MTAPLLTLFICVLLLSYSATSMTLKYLRKKAILDHPNERSSHSTPTPRGGGIGLLAAIIPALILINIFSDATLAAFWVVLASTLALALLSWLDDLHTLGAGIRFLLQFLAVGISLYVMPNPEGGYLGGVLPIWIEKCLLGIGWVWFINLFNFMDGIDGISGVEIATIALGISLIAYLNSLDFKYVQSGLVFCAAAIGFLRWNWHKAQIFMGDVGSVPIGFMLGWLLILLAGEGFIIAALILPLYYLADATITLLKRAKRGEKIWQAHREHYYQKATQSGLSHDQVALRILFLNILLIFCTYFALIGYAIPALIGAICLVSGLLFHFKQCFEKSRP